MNATWSSIKATRPTAAPPFPGGGFTYSNQLPPVAAGYNQWVAGNQFNAALPRDPTEFLTGAFSPLVPIEPIAIDAPAEGEDRPFPRRWVYPVGWNMPIGVPGSEGLKLTSFDNLRTIGQTYSVARACISLRIKELVGLDWDIRPTPEAEKKMRGSAKAHREFAERRGAILKFWRRPDPGNYESFSTWFTALLDDVFVIDALSLYLQPARKRGKGVLGSDLAALCLLDGSTIRPLLDLQGARPAPPNPAYQSYYYGVPRVDLMTAIRGDDLEPMKESLIAEYRGDQLKYLPFNRQTWTPYGFAPIEQALVPILSGLQRQKWQLDFFSEGTVPAVYIAAGDGNMTPNQCRELQDALNAIAGDPAWKHKIIVIPGGSKIEPQKPASLADQFDEVVMNQVCMAFDVMPEELGILPKVAAVQTPSAALQMSKASQDVMKRKSLKPMLMWLKSNIFDYVIQDLCGQDDMEWSWEALEEGDDRMAMINEIKSLVAIGEMSIDEGRARLDLPPWGLPITSDPVFFTQQGIVPLGSIDPTTGLPIGQSPQFPATIEPARTFPGKPGSPGGDGSGSGSTSPTPSSVTPHGSTPAHAAAGNPDASGPVSLPPSPAGSVANAAPPAGGRTSRARKMLTDQLGEIERMRRVLRKGRAIDQWRPGILDADLITTISQEVILAGPGHAIGHARTLVKRAYAAARRDETVAQISARITAQLTRLAQGVEDGRVSTATFLHEGTETLRQGIREGVLAGAHHAMKPQARKQDESSDDEPDDLDLADSPYGDYLDGLAEQEAQTQSGYLLGLLQDILALIGVAGWLTRLAARLGLYGDTARRAYNQGYGLTLLAQDPDARIIWHTTSAKPCALCAGRNGEQFTAATLPGWPGDGAFGGPICMGGPACHCVLEYAAGADSYTAGQSALSTSGYAQELREQQAVSQELIAQARAGRRAWGASQPKAAVKAATEITNKPSNKPDQTHEVYAYLARHYPAGLLEWVKTAVWRGPKQVRLKNIDMARRPGGARDQAKIDLMVRAIEDGTPPDAPIVLVQCPGEDKYQIVDGWHRTDAFKRAGHKTIRAWIGAVDTDQGPWTGALNRAKLNKRAEL